MKRFAAIFVIALASVSSGAAAVSLAANPPRAHLRDFLCQRAIDPAQRSDWVTAVMRPVPETKKMAMRFELFSKPQLGGPYAAVHAADLGTWRFPDRPPTLGQRPNDVWIVNYSVGSLPAPAIYRYQVTFRWTGAHNRVLSTRTLIGPKCFEPELRPDLSVRSIVVGSVPNRPHMASYTALIGNAGATGAGPFQVQFTPGGSSVSKTHTIEWLGPHSTREQTFIGPVCTTATAPTITVDPSHEIADFNPSNNSLLATCPAPPSGS